MMHTGAARYDLDRFGIIFRPRHASAALLSALPPRLMAISRPRSRGAVFSSLPPPSAPAVCCATSLWLC